MSQNDTKISKTRIDLKITPEQKQLLQFAAKAFRAGERYLKKGLSALKVVILAFGTNLLDHYIARS